MVEEDQQVSHRSLVPTIRELIQRAVDDGKSYRALEESSGGRVKYQMFQKLATKPPLQFPKDRDTIEGIAAALEIPESTVVLAYARGIGLDVTTDSLLADLLPRGTEDLDIEMQNAIVAVVRAAIRMQRGQRNASADSSTPPGTPSPTSQNEETPPGDRPGSPNKPKSGRARLKRHQSGLRGQVQDGENSADQGA